jgi:hypothetical protein
LFSVCVFSAYSSEKGGINQPVDNKKADTKTTIYAWALLTNHAYILLRSSEIG